jgi:hypothetical protein
MGMNDWATLLGLIGLIFGGLTKMRTWLFEWLGRIDLGNKKRNTRLRLVVGALFFSSLGLTGLSFAVFLMIGVSFSAIQEYLNTEQSLEKVQVTSATDLESKAPYLGVLLHESEPDTSRQFSVVHFQKEIIRPLRKGIVTVGVIVGFVLVMLIGLLGIIGFILGSKDARRGLN